MWRVTGFKTIANNFKGRPYADLGISMQDVRGCVRIHHGQRRGRNDRVPRVRERRDGTDSITYDPYESSPGKGLRAHLLRARGTL